MPDRDPPATYTGQVERDKDGILWAVLYLGAAAHPRTMVAQQRVRSLRQGKRRITDMVLAGVTWCGDLTEIPTDEGAFYLAGILDLHSRRCVGSRWTPITTRNWPGRRCWWRSQCVVAR